MTETFTLKEVCDDVATRDTIVSYCVLDALSQLNAFIDPKLTEEIKASQSVEMHLTLNGREVSLRAFLNQFQTEHTRMLKEMAEHLLKERMGKLQNTIYKLEQEANQTLSDIMSEQ